MAQIIIRGLITKAIMSAIGMGGGSISVGAGPSSFVSSFTGGSLAMGGIGFAKGGYIRGAGNATSDSIPAMLSNGEYVLNAAAVKRIGVPRLNAINNGGIPAFAGGGYIGTGGGTGASAPNVIINVENQTGMPVTAEQTGSGFDGESWVLNVVMHGVATNKMGITSLLKGVSG